MFTKILQLGNHHWAALIAFLFLPSFYPRHFRVQPDPSGGGGGGGDGGIIVPSRSPVRLRAVWQGWMDYGRRSEMRGQRILIVGLPRLMGISLWRLDYTHQDRQGQRHFKRAPRSVARLYMSCTPPTGFGPSAKNKWRNKMMGSSFTPPPTTIIIRLGRRQ